MSANRSQKVWKGVQARESGAANHKNGHAYVHVISPATASEIRKRLRIKTVQVSNILRAFNTAGVKV